MNERVHRAVELEDREAEDEAILGGMRVQTREKWQDFPELELLGDHSRRAALRKAGRGSPGATDIPTHEEGLRLARAVLAHAPGRLLLALMPSVEGMDTEWESQALSALLAHQWIRERSPRMVAQMKNHSHLRVYFDAIILICEELKFLGEEIRPPLRYWKREFDSGRRKRPGATPLPNHPPVTLPKLVSDLNIQLAIEILSRIGIRPEGKDISGIHLVEMALEDSEDKTLRLTHEGLRRVWARAPLGKPLEVPGGEVLKCHHRAPPARPPQPDLRLRKAPVPSVPLQYRETRPALPLHQRPSPWAMACLRHPDRGRRRSPREPLHPKWAI